MRILVFLLLLPLTLYAQKNYPFLLDSFMRGEVFEMNFNGNILVAKSGEIIYQKSFGYRNFNSKEILDNNSVYYIASVSKQFTAMCILMLKEDGKLNLHDSLRKFFPQLPYYNITIQQMLTHTSGLPKYEVEVPKKWDHHKVAFNDDLIAFLAREKPPVRFNPGDKWEYSNTAFVLLASIIEKVTGQKFADFIANRIFNSLGMENTRIYNTRRSSNERIPDYAYGYMYSDSFKRYILPDSLPFYNIVYYLDGIEGDGDVNTTTTDLYKWQEALMKHSILNDRLKRELLEPHSLFDTALNINYGYGVFLGENEMGKYITHTGIWPGYRTILTYYYTGDITIIIFSNNESNASAISNAIAYILFNREVIFP
jgi:CubicO group peptidase (beta-lactamase class C family)